MYAKTDQVIDSLQIKHAGALTEETV